MCRRIPQLLPKISRGELPVGDARRVDLHLSLCDSCRGLAAEAGYLAAAPTAMNEVRDGLSDWRTRLAAQLDTPPTTVQSSHLTAWIIVAVVVFVGIAAAVIQMA